MHVPPLSPPVSALKPIIQSIQFLVAVKEYEESLRVQDELDATNLFEKLSEIIDKFVRDRSPFEVNVGSNVKCAVLKMADAANFMELSLVRLCRTFEYRCERCRLFREYARTRLVVVLLFVVADVQFSPPDY